MESARAAGRSQNFLNASRKNLELFKTAWEIHIRRFRANRHAELPPRRKSALMRRARDPQDGEFSAFLGLRFYDPLRFSLQIFRFWRATKL